MMKNMSISKISFASIIPGLGLFLVKRRRHGLISGFLVVGLILISILTIGSEIISKVSLYSAIIVWGLQMRYAAHMAHLLEQLKKPGRERANGNIDVNRLHSTDLDRKFIRMREYTRRQLQPGDSLLDVLPGSMTSARGMPSSYYVGVTKNELLLIECDLFGKPVILQRVPNSEIDLVKSKQEMFYDTLVLYSMEYELASVRVPRKYRETTLRIVNMFNLEE